MLSCLTQLSASQDQTPALAGVFFMAQQSKNGIMTTHSSYLRFSLMRAIKSANSLVVSGNPKPVNQS